jgi:hypothetical protein
MNRLALILTVTLISLGAHAEQGPRPIFIKATCDGTIPSNLLASFKEAISASQKYQLVPTLDDNGRMDVVIVVEMSCVERNKIVAVASAFGLAKCFGPKNCHSTLDGTSLSALLCDPNGEVVCGRELFKGLEYYLANSQTHLKVY